MTATQDEPQMGTAHQDADLKHKSTHEQADYIDVRYLLRVLMRWSWVIALVTGGAAAKGAWDMHNFTPQFTAWMAVKPIESSASAAGPSLQGTGASLLGAIGGLRIDVSRPASNFDRLMYRMSSITLARVLDEKYNMMRVVYGNALDMPPPSAESMTWRQRMRLFLKFSPPSKPTHEDLAGYFQGKLILGKSEDSPFESIAFTHSDPEKALWFLTTVFSEGVAYLRSEFKIESEERREFLETRLAETEVVELRRELLSLISAEIRKEMLSHGNLPVGAEIIDEAFVSKYQTQPNMLKYIGFPSVIAVAVMVGLIWLIALYRAE